MRTSNHGQVIGIPISSIMYPFDQRSPKPLLTCNTSTQHHTSHFPLATTCDMKRSRVDSVRNRMNKLGKKAETVKTKLMFGTRILQFGGVDKIFKKLFCAKEGERLMKASQCCLSTTAGPISGILFISTHKIAFCSQKSIKFSSPNGKIVRARYKVVIPLSKIERVSDHENEAETSQKFMEVVTVDNFEFWFMGFLNYHKAFKYLQNSVPQA